MQQHKDRVEPRVRAVMRARLRWAGGDREVTVIDASSRGMLAMAPEPPERGEFVEMIVGHHALVGQVRWRAGKRFGLSFRERISVAALLEGGPGSIALAGRIAARGNRGGLVAALTMDAGSLARAMQFAAVLVVAGCGAWAVVHYSGSGLSSVGKAREAMAQGGRTGSR